MVALLVSFWERGVADEILRLRRCGRSVREGYGWAVAGYVNEATPLDLRRHKFLDCNVVTLVGVEGDAGVRAGLYSARGLESGRV